MGADGLTSTDVAEQAGADAAGRECAGAEVSLGIAPTLASLSNITRTPVTSRDTRSNMAVARRESTHYTCTVR